MSWYLTPAHCIGFVLVAEQRLARTARQLLDHGSPPIDAPKNQMKTATRIVLAAALCYSTVAAADQITLHWASPPFAPLPGSLAGPYNFTVKPNGGSAQSGSVNPDEYHGTVTAASPLSLADGIGDKSGIPEDLLTYCYELTQYFSGGQNVNYQIIYGNAAGGVTNDTLDWLGAVNSVLNQSEFNYGWLHPTNANMAAAIQLGIWETRYDAGAFGNLNNLFDTTSNFYLTGNQNTLLGTGSGSVHDYLVSFITAVPTHGSLDQQYALRLTNDGAQDQITGRYVPTSQRNDVPEPGSLALLGIGMAATALARRYRKQ